MSPTAWTAPQAIVSRPADVIRGSGRDSITPHARNLYRFLLRYGAMPGAEIAVHTQLPPDLIHNCLKELIDVGLVAYGGGPATAIPYDTAVDSLVAAQSRALGQALETVRETQRRLRLLIAEGAALGGDSAGTVLAAAAPTGEDDASFDDTQTRPVSDLAALHPGARFSPDLLEGSLKRAEAHLTEGVRLRVIHQRAALSHPRSVEYFRRVEGLGGQVRLRENLPFRLMLVDDRAAVCRLTYQDGPQETLLLQGPHMLGLLGRLFETTWIDSIPLGDAPAPPEYVSELARAEPLPALTGQQQTIMRYLADGATDQAIARFLGITTRTVTRRVNEIYQTLGVQSRFQAGAAARRMGLI
jgi:DNA-binding CsgD family transcriptional regulator